MKAEILREMGIHAAGQGTNHAWLNTFDEPCQIAFALGDALGSPACEIPAEA
jgi:hypothetical protein